MQIQSVPRSKHIVPVTKTNQLMLYMELIAVCSQIHTKHINALCGQNVELLNVKLVIHIVTTRLYGVVKNSIRRREIISKNSSPANTSLTLPLAFSAMD